VSLWGCMSPNGSGGPDRDDRGHRVDVARQGSATASDYESELSEILAVAAHELRTPATVILGLAATLAANRARMTEDQVEEAIARLDRQANRLVGLLQDLLDVSRIQSGKLEVSVDSVDLTEAVSGALTIVAPPHGTHVSVAIPAGIAVLAEEPGLERVLVNLLTNAYRYGGPNVRIEARHAD